MLIKRNLVAGEWVEGTSVLRNVNPSNLSDVVGDYAEATTAQVADATSAAREAQIRWTSAPLRERSGALHAIAGELERRRDELAVLLAREEGKTVRDALGEVARAVEIFRYFAGEVFRHQGDRAASSRPGVTIEVMPEPVGVVGLITPWNFPLAIPAWKIAPALAYGNAVLFKPSELVPACAWELMQIVAGVTTKGLVNLLMGGGEVGRAVVDNVDAVSFTGSVTTGRMVVAQAGKRMIPAQCELGGKNPLVVLGDADLELAIECAVQGAFYQTGQRCTASSRLIVEESVHDRFVLGLHERMQTLAVDDALKSETDIGPVVNEAQLAKDLDYIRIGEAEGARRLIGGEPLNRQYEGYYLSPALFLETTNRMRINREEIFGPIAAVIPVRGYDEALEVANDTEFGLSASIITTSLKHAQHFKAQVRSGLAFVNLPTAGVDYHVPLSGSKLSSYGQPEMGRYAARFYTKIRTAYTFAG